MTVQHVVTGAGAPTQAPPSVGAHYIDLSSGDTYSAKGTTGAGDWIKLNGLTIASMALNEIGHLIATYSDTTTADLGLVKGADGTNGADGANGADGTDGRGITSMALDANGHLIVTYSDTATADLGLVKGADGADGANGVDGTDGRGVSSFSVNQSTGEVTVTYTDSTTQSLGALGGGVSIAEDSVLIEADTTLTKAAHQGKFIEVNSADPVLLTVGDASTSGWSLGATIDGVQSGEGHAKFIAGDGVNILRKATKLGNTDGPGSVFSLKRLYSDMWLLSGDLEPYVPPPAYYLTVGLGGSPFIQTYTTDTYGVREAPASLPSGDVNAVTYSPDGTLMAVGHSGGECLTVYNTSDMSKVAIALAPYEPVEGLAFSPDGSKLAVATTGSTCLKIYKTDDWTSVELPSIPSNASANTVEFSHDGTILALGVNYGDNRCYLYNTADWSQLRALSGLGSVYGLQFSPDDSKLYVSHYGHPSSLINEFVVATGELSGGGPSVIDGNSMAAKCVLSPDGKWLAVCLDNSTDSYLRIFSTSDWSSPVTLPQGSGPVTESMVDAAFSPDSQFLAYLDGRARLVVLNTSDWSVAIEPATSGAYPYDIAYCPSPITTA